MQSALTSAKDKIASSPILLILALVAIAIVVFGVFYGINHEMSLLPSVRNMRRISDEQYYKLLSKYALVRTRHTQDGMWNLPSDTVPERDRILLNTSVQSVRLAGYLGPYENGVFSEERAVRLALQTGARLLVLEIGMNYKTGRPTLIYKAPNGYKKSLNEGNIFRMAKAINDLGFNSLDAAPPSVANFPLIIFLYFREAPDYVSQTRDYIRFMAQVSTQLEPLNRRLLGSSPMGDFRNLGLEDQLFFQKLDYYNNSIIMLCNANLDALQNPSTYGYSFQSGENLRFKVHGMVYGLDSGGARTQFGITALPPTGKKPAAVLRTPQYFMDIPENAINNAIDGTKQTFTICMNADATDRINIKTIDRCINNFGVHSIPFVIFDEEDVKNEDGPVSNVDQWIGKGAVYETRSYRTKSKILRLEVPDPIVTELPSTKTNANGGTINVPG